jgi:hypothetical protein
MSDKWPYYELNVLITITNGTCHESMRENSKPIHMYVQRVFIYFLNSIQTVFIQWLRFDSIRLGQQMYIKPLPIPTLMNMNDKLLNALQINDLIQRFLCTCIHVYMYVCYTCACASEDPG